MLAPISHPSEAGLDADTPQNPSGMCRDADTVRFRLELLQHLFPGNFRNGASLGSPQSDPVPSSIHVQSIGAATGMCCSPCRPDWLNQRRFALEHKGRSNRPRGANLVLRFFWRPGIWRSRSGPPTRKLRISSSPHKGGPISLQRVRPDAHPRHYFG